MEVRAFAQQVLFSAEIDHKLASVNDAFTDASPGESVRIFEPARTPDLTFAGPKKAPSMPRPGAFVEPTKRALAHHILANHELQALEVMAFIALLFTEAPTEFRLGLARIMQDEQRHTRMHIERAAHLGVKFGAYPVNSYIWNKAQEVENLLDYIATLPLVFEGRNLDHTLEFATYFAKAGDERSAAMMRIIHRDEIEHVAFGINWLRKLQPTGADDWQTFCQHLKWPLRPSKARGDVFQLDARRQAGFTDDFIARLQSADIDLATEE